MVRRVQKYKHFVFLLRKYQNLYCTARIMQVAYLYLETEIIDMPIKGPVCSFCLEQAGQAGHVCDMHAMASLHACLVCGTRHKKVLDAVQCCIDKDREHLTPGELERLGQQRLF